MCGEHHHSPYHAITPGVQQRSRSTDCPRQAQRRCTLLWCAPPWQHCQSLRALRGPACVLRGLAAMSDYWVSQAKHFCNYCKVWVQGDKQVCVA
jgi:hypothetical protein